MHILIVTHYFYPEQFRINDLTQSLLARGHQVTVLTGLPNYPKGEWMDGYGYHSIGKQDWQGVRIVRVPTLRRFASKGWQLALNYFSFVASACALAPFWCREDYDLIFTYEPSPFTVGIPAVMMRWWHGIPMMFWVQDLWPESLTATGAVNSKKIVGLVALMVKWIYRRCDRVLVQSKGFIPSAIDAGANKESIVYFPNWAESLYQAVHLADDAIERTEVPSDSFVVMFAGNLGVAQSLETIMQAAEMTKNENIYWVFLGDGRRRIWMQEKKDSNALDKVYILGSKPVETMPAYFSLADAMLVTLLADPVMTMTIPGKVQSYLACGRPIIGALDGEGANVIRESECGLAVASGDALGLAEAVIKVSKMDKQQREEMGKNALGYYKNNFDREPLVDQLERWMNALAKKTP